jgi:hypothetical protein
VLKSLNEFDKQEVRGVIAGVLAKTDRDNCFAGLYYRGKANIESLLSLKSIKDIQAITMVTRCLFELAVDMKLIDSIQDAVAKMVAFSDVEKLRAAKNIVRFRGANPKSSVDSSIQAAYIANSAPRIDATRNSLWPGVKKVDRKRLTNTPVRQAGSVLKCPDVRKNRVVSAQATYPCGSSAVGGRVCEQRYAAERILPESRFKLQHTGSPSKETELEEKA